MPEIEITEDQRDRLRAVQESLEADVVGKYGHVRASDAVEYLLDRYESDPDAGAPDGGGGTDDAGDTDEADDADAEAGDTDEADDADANADEADDADAEADDADAEDDDAGTTMTGEDDAELDAMMSLLDDHDDRWREADGSEARYEVDLPDGTTESARTKDDVRGLLFRHYR